MDTQPQSQIQSSPNSNQRGISSDAVGPVPQSQPLAVQPGAIQERSESADSDTGLSEQDRQFIDRAIAAIEDNSGDPYTQNNSINDIKTEYLKEKFDKQINNDA